MRSLNLNGDRQADLTVHGGLEQAVYVCPFEPYDHWHSEFPDTALTMGNFGGNLMTIGLSEVSS